MYVYCSLLVSIIEQEGEIDNKSLIKSLVDLTMEITEFIKVTFGVDIFHNFLSLHLQFFFNLTNLHLFGMLKIK